MVSKAERYMMSKKFEKAMSKVGSDSIPFNNSTPTKVVLEKIRGSVQSRQPSDAK
jgi:hypothetical protein